ncbi:uncharacterized protein LOC107809695 isoform X2 [Nicotiana tabacum]|uniref:Uncharacterized protein LOC107809695 isoform X2 n=1 Tax=Nicotiana tabacum TaxID=4097 RepID=A0AC58U3Q5_TOBAC
MSIQRFFTQDRAHQTNEFSSDYTLEFPKISAQDLVAQQQYSSHMGFCFQPEKGRQQQHQQTCNLPIATASSNTIISFFGSPTSAFFATERCLGLTQYDNQDNTSQHMINNNDLNQDHTSQLMIDNYDLNQDNTSQLINNYDIQLSSYDPQQSRNGFLTDSIAQPEPDFQHNISLSSFIRPEFSTSQPLRRQYSFADVSEKERMLHLKNELLGEFDPSYRRHPSIPFDGNQNYSISHDFCGCPLENMRQQCASPSLTSHNSASSGVSNKHSKTRIRWSEDLHERFLECVNRLGGADTTPKQILNLMDLEGLTLDHVKSHLQKYRNAKHIPESTETGKSEKRNSPDNVTEIDNKTGIEIKEALKMQLEVQRCLHEQLETQRTLQMRIEEQAKKLKMIFDQQQKTNRVLLERQNSNISSLADPSTAHDDVEILVVEELE